MRAVLMDDGKIQSGDSAVPPQSHPEPALESGARGTQPVFLGACDAQHHRSAGLAAEQRGYRHDRVRSALGAESAAAGLGDVHEVFRFHAEQPAKARNQRGLALG